MEAIVPYIMLAVAIGSEIIATTLLNYSEGLTRLYPTIGCVVAYTLCHISFAKVIEKINLGAAYATWCGVGIIATTLISFFLFKEEISVLGAIGILLIVVGCILLNLFGTAG